MQPLSKKGHSENDSTLIGRSTDRNLKPLVFGMQRAAAAASVYQSSIGGTNVRQDKLIGKSALTAVSVAVMVIESLYAGEQLPHGQRNYAHRRKWVVVSAPQSRVRGAIFEFRRRSRGDDGDKSGWKHAAHPHQRVQPEL